ncbi:MAG TPA: CapA family protein [Cyclobacteriaceae bacterium]
MRLFILLLLFSISGYAQDTTLVKLLFVGDVMQHDSQIWSALNLDSKKYDYSACFQYVSPVIQSADLALANLEVTLAGHPYKGYPQFSAPDELAAGLKHAGFDVLVTANNHCVDRRKAGLERTIAVLDSLDISHTGTFKDSASRAQSYPLVVSSNGIKFSLLNYTYGTNGIPISTPNMVNLIDTVQIKTDLEKARLQATDAIIVFMHWGDEYKSEPNKFQKMLTDFCFKNGATLIVGSHPHVLQPMEWKKDKNQLIAYSLGNFVSGQQSRYRDGGAMLWIELEKILSDSVSTTRIKDAYYELAWVYRNHESPKKYFLLPLKEFESDTVKVNDQAAQSNLKLFATDSRKLLNENNINVKESDRTPIENSYFQILLKQAADTILFLDTTSLINFYGAHVEKENDSLYRLMSNKFFDREVAEQAFREIKASTVYTDATLIWFYWGRRRNDLLSGK